MKRKPSLRTSRASISKLRKLFAWLSKGANQRLLAFLGSGASAITIAVWTVFVYTNPSPLGPSSGRDEVDTRPTGSQVRGREVLCKLLIPLRSHMRTSAELVSPWVTQKRYRDALAMRDANAASRSILVTNAVLVPPELRRDRDLLIRHYDVWLGRFAAELPRKEPALNDSFFFYSAPGYGFPKASETRFFKLTLDYEAAYGPCPE